MTKEVPKFMLSTTGVILSVIFFPIGIFVLFFATLIYLADWITYNFDWPSPIAYIIAFLFTPFLIPLLIVSALFRYGEIEKEKNNKVKKKSKK